MLLHIWDLIGNYAREYGQHSNTVFESLNMFDESKYPMTNQWEIVGLELGVASCDYGVLSKEPRDHNNCKIRTHGLKNKKWSEANIKIY